MSFLSLDSIYNFVALGVSILAFLLATRYRNFVGMLAAFVFCWCGLLVLGVALAVNTFHAMKLVTYGWLIHLPAFCLILSLYGIKFGKKISFFWLAISVIGFSISADAFLLEPHLLQETRIKMSSEKISHPIRLAIVADLQTDSVGDYEKKVFRRLKDAKPDIVLFAGDYLQLDSVRRDYEFQQLKTLIDDLSQHVTYIIGVGGNIDGRGWVSLFDGSNAISFSVTGQVEMEGIQFSGLSVQDSFQTQLTIDPSDRYHVVLGHSPNFALGEVAADLLVAGHTHGGQVRFPGFGPLITFSDVPRSWASGVTEVEPGKKLIVSRGVGMERGRAPRIRFFCPPEIIYVDLSPIPSKDR